MSPEIFVYWLNGFFEISGLEAIKKVYPKRYKKSKNEKNVPDKVQ
jgi:hypothetical protein